MGQDDSSVENTPRRSPPPKRKGARFAGVTSPPPTSKVVISAPQDKGLEDLRTPELKVVAGEIVADAVNKGVAMSIAEDAVNKGVAMEIVADAVKKGAQFAAESSDLSSLSMEKEKEEE